MRAIFLQVRLDSQRLPRKALLPLAGRSVIAHAMSALREVDVDRYAILTDQGGAVALAPEAAACGFEVFVGSSDDVLDRYYRAALHFGVDTIVRATGDNPLVSAEIATVALAERARFEADYCGLYGVPLGTGVEVFQTEAIRRAWSETQHQYDREHVTPYLYNNPQRFVLHRPAAPACWRNSSWRLTLDTRADYHYLSGLFAALYRGRPIEISDLLAYAAHQPAHTA